MKWQHSLLCLTVLIPGCVGGPMKMPEIALPEAYLHAESDASGPGLDGDWWTIFENPQLHVLLARIAAENPGYAVMLKRIEEARLALALTEAQRSPWLAYDFSAGRRKASGAGSAFNGGRTRSDFDLPLTVRYEVDAWGRIKRGIAAGEAEAAASEADAATLLLSLQSGLAARYFAFQSIVSEKRVLDKAVGIRQKALDLTRARFKAGDISEIDVTLAETELAEVKAERIGLERTGIALKNEIAALVGQPPSALTLMADGLADEPPAVSPGLPSDLIKRRPDIRAAGKRMEAEFARVGLSRTLFFPSFALSGSTGFQAEDSGDLGGSDSRTWEAVATMTGPIFQGGANRTARKIADARFEQAESQYRATVVEAIRESETALGVIDVLDRQIQAYRATVKAARRSVVLTEKQYRAGLVDYFEVVNAQRTLLRNEQATIRSLAQRYQALIELIKALGGRW